MSTKHIPHSHTSKEKQRPLVVATPIATEKELEHVQPEAAPVAKDAPHPEGEPVKSGDFSNEETIRTNIASGVNDLKARCQRRGTPGHRPTDRGSNEQAPR